MLGRVLKLLEKWRPRVFRSPYTLGFLILLLPAFIVNGLTFNGDTISFDFKDMFFLSTILNADKIKLYLSLIPVLTLTIAYLTWYNNKNFQRISDINGLLEELRHNINLCAPFCALTNESSFYKNVYDHIKRLGICEYYPVDMNAQAALLPFIHRPTYEANHRFIKLRNDFIIQAISSKSYFHLKHHRMFLNLGHLNFSIHRHNLNIDTHNFCPTTQTFSYIQNEYFYWLHCRLHYTLVDLLTSVDARDIIDHDYLDNMKNYLK